MAIAAYLGSSDRSDEAVADFAEIYPNRNDEDIAQLKAAIQDGRLQVQTGL